MNDVFNGFVGAHPKTCVMVAFGLGLGLVPLLKAIGWVF